MLSDQCGVVVSSVNRIICENQIKMTINQSIRLTLNQRDSAFHDFRNLIEHIISNKDKDAVIG